MMRCEEMSWAEKSELVAVAIEARPTFNESFCRRETWQSKMLFLQLLWAFPAEEYNCSFRIYWK